MKTNALVKKSVDKAFNTIYDTFYRQITHHYLAVNFRFGGRDLSWTINKSEPLVGWEEQDPS